MRELRNALERAAILADGDSVREEHLLLDDSAPRAAASSEVKPLAALEREAILRTLERVNGSRRRAAELLGIGERTLYDKLKRYGVDA